MYERLDDGKINYFVFMHEGEGDPAYAVIQNMNSLMYTTFNFLFLLVMFFMLFKIRAIEDQTRIKHESAFIMVILVFFSSVQLFFYYV